MNPSYNRDSRTTRLFIFGVYERNPIYMFLKKRKWIVNQHEDYLKISYELRTLKGSNQYEEIWISWFERTLFCASVYHGNLVHIPREMLKKERKILDTTYVIIEDLDLKTQVRLDLKPTLQQIQTLTAVICTHTAMLTCLCVEIAHYVLGDEKETQ